MRRKAATRTITFRTTDEQHALAPELCRLHGGEPLSMIIRRLLDQELQRLNLCKQSTTNRVARRSRYTT